MQALKDWYFELEKRDQTMLNVLAVALLLFVLIDMIFLSIYDERNMWKARASAVSQQVAILEQDVASIKGNQTGVSGNARLSLSQVAQGAAKRANLRLSKFQPKGDIGQVWLDKVAFDDVLVFLATVEEQYQANVLSVAINQANQTGLVNVRLKFSK